MSTAGPDTPPDVSQSSTTDSAPAGGHRLTGKVAMVTGAASGIGRAIAERLVADGAAVALGDVDEAGLDEVVASLGDQAVAIGCDVTDDEGPAGLAALAIERFGRLDVAVANAGGGTAAPIVDHSPAEWRRVVELNLTGTFLTVQAAARVMEDGGSIVAMSSLAALQPARGQVGYGAAKAGVIGVVEVAALELGPRGIRVNAIAPGLVRTPATEMVWRVPGMVEAYETHSALGTHAVPGDIAATVSFLASDDAGMITGSTLTVDGGAHRLGYPDTGAVIRRATGG